MRGEGLTNNEKASLLANMDARGQTAIDEEFERILAETKPLKPHELTDSIRYALAIYIQELPSRFKRDIANDPNSFEAYASTWLSIAWLHGYQVALKWGKSIEITPERK